MENERATTFPSDEVGASQMRRHGGGGFWRAGAIAPGFKHVDVLPALENRALEFVRRQDDKTPFFLYFPLTAPHTPWMPTDAFRGGTVSDQLVCLTDCLATLAEISGRELAAGEGEDSFSFVSVLSGQPPRRPLRTAIVHQSGDGTLAIRGGAWKLCPKLGSHGFSAPRAAEPTRGGPAGQLYHLGDDPAETKNLWLENPEIVERLQSLLTRYQQQGYSRPHER